MSAGFRKYDKIWTLEKLGLSWHKLDILKKDEEMTVTGSPIDFEVKECPVQVEYLNAHFRDSEKKGLVDDKNKMLITTVPESYGVIQNVALWEAVAAGLEGVPYEITSIFTLDNKCKMAIAIDLRQNECVGKDEFKSFLTILNSFDGSYRAQAYDSHTRAVCANTVAMGLAEKHSINLSIRHTRHAALRIDNMRKAVDTALEQRKEFYANLRKIASMEIDAYTAANALIGWVANGDKLSTRAKNQAENIFSLFVGRNNAIAIDGATRYGLFNAVTQYFTRSSSDVSEGVKDIATMSQLSQSEFGTGATRKAQAYRLLTEFTDEQLNLLADKGQVLLSEWENARSTANVN